MLIFVVIMLCYVMLFVLFNDCFTVGTAELNEEYLESDLQKHSDART